MTEIRQFMNDSEIVDVTEMFKGFGKLHTRDVYGIFFLCKKGLKMEDRILLKGESEYDLKDIIQIVWEKRGKSIPTFYFQLS
jgi:hypothetical protein